MRKSFASVEALLALLFASAFFAASLSLSRQQPDYYASAYKFQLAQDLAEASVSDELTLSQISGFAAGNQASKQFLYAEYSRLAGELGDYCIELGSGGNGLSVNCGRTPVSKVSVSRMVFDGHDFRKVSFTIGFYA